MADKPQFYGEDGECVPKTVDPSAWAHHFVHVIAESRSVQLDHTAVMSWFKRAIEAGFEDARETLVRRLMQDHRKVYGCATSDAVRLLFDKSQLRPPKARVGSRWAAETPPPEVIDEATAKPPATAG